MTMPATAGVPSVDFVASSVDAAAVALLVELENILLRDADNVVATEPAKVVDDDANGLPVRELLDGSAVSIEPLVSMEDPAAVSIVDERPSNDVEKKEVRLVRGAVKSVDEVSGAEVLLVLEEGPDVRVTSGVVAMNVMDVSELGKIVVIALIVAVMVPAISGNAPTTPSQIVYPLCI